MRMKVATGLLAGVLSLLGGANVTAAVAETLPTEVRYACDPAQRLIVTKSATKAAVQFIDRKYELERTASSIGEKYLSSTAALIIDGPSAVFIAEDRLQLGECVEVTSLPRS
jgi:hypothetical protein